MIMYAATSIPNIMVSLPVPMIWDPGSTEFPTTFTIATDATKLQSTYVYNPKVEHVFVVDLSATSAPIFAYLHHVTLLLIRDGQSSTLVVPCFKGKPVAKHAMFLSNSGCPMTIAYAITMCSHNSASDKTEPSYGVHFDS
jgi:hypothetical protein